MVIKKLNPVAAAAQSRDLVILTVLSLGTRVGLSYWLASVPGIGETGIGWSIPVGWAIADLVGIGYYFFVNCGKYSSRKHKSDG